MDTLLDFAHLDEDWDLFPFSCSSGYYFLWNCRLSAPAKERKDDPDALLKQELSLLKTQFQKR